MHAHAIIIMGRGVSVTRADWHIRLVRVCDDLFVFASQRDNSVPAATHKDKHTFAHGFIHYSAHSSEGRARQAKRSKK